MEKKKTGFNHFNLPNLNWILRILIWADPNMKNEVFERMALNKKSQ